MTEDQGHASGDQMQFRVEKEAETEGFLPDDPRFGFANSSECPVLEVTIYAEIRQYIDAGHEHGEVATTPHNNIKIIKERYSSYNDCLKSGVRRSPELNFVTKHTFDLST